LIINEEYIDRVNILKETNELVRQLEKEELWLEDLDDEEFSSSLLD
jgi:hypothetical protein